MSLEEDKKLIAEFMGWTLITEDYFGSDRVEIVEKEIYMQGWNPQTDRNAWPEIWDKIASDLDVLYLYLDNLDYMMDWKALEKKYPQLEGKHEVWFGIHTAPPEVCFKALIKTIKEQAK